MEETTERKKAFVHVVWDPNTGKLDFVAENANAMEQIGMLEWGINALCAVKRATPTSSIVVPDHTGKIA